MFNDAGVKSYLSAGMAFATATNCSSKTLSILSLAAVSDVVPSADCARTPIALPNVNNTTNKTLFMVPISLFRVVRA